ncbi:hypothetical protein SUGI_0538760 [Cryptomeria japonica]|nr:hypothetical protein SUGI_0538760 [Cryptomeria japonica]
MLSVLVFLLLNLAVIAQPAGTSHNSTFSDQQALTAFKKSLILDPFNSLQNWSPSLSLCNWTGVICSSRRERVAYLNLRGKGLVGPISPLVGNLSFLRVLDLFNNSLQGPLPYQLGKLFRLRILRLSYNRLEGPIPSTIGDCNSLQILSLYVNHLSGSIPSQLGLLSNLEFLFLGTNQLAGPVPPSLTNLSSLTQLYLNENKLNGGIPVELGVLTQLEVLNLEKNKFSGPIPRALSNCTRLQVLSLLDNQLTAYIPWQLCKLSELQKLYLGENQFNREIPGCFSNCTLLQHLDLDDNNLSGTVPLAFGRLLHLQRLKLFKNNLDGGGRGLSILTALTNCSSLEIIDFGFNHFSGVLPSSVGQLSSKISIFMMDHNQIEGSIPDEISNLTKLDTLDLGANSFNGTIPSTLGGLPSLQRLYMYGNNLHGTIPKSLGQAKNLGLLHLSDNMLSGEIPGDLGILSQLRRLLLSYNNLSGKIPANLGRCQALEKLDLSYNKLIGNIPPEVASLQNIQFFFNVSNNLLHGGVLEMSKMTMVQAIDVSHNLFSGEIPIVLESCKALEYLSLSWNSFAGPIPQSLANLQNLQYMDLSCNNLSGAIPVVFKEMKMLQKINLSSNRLVGEVPNGGVFTALDASALMGNLGLCGTWVNLPPCSYSKDKHPSISKKVIIPIAIAIVIIFMSFLAIFYGWRRINWNIISPKVEPVKVTYEQLVDATDGFNVANLLGTGKFGSVYKGILNSGKNIAVKVLNLQDENGHKSFSRECNILKRVRHRNVMKIISSCSNLDFKALIFPFMSNGSLERWLYPQEGDECRLSLIDRLRISIEIAHGMAYLHHHCFVQVIHCDLKPNNILLGDDMTSYIADFGIAKLLFGNSMDSEASTNALKGSIGYIPPEYGMGSNVSTKGDVYSYGVLLLELFTRRRPTDDMFVEEINLQKWVEMNFPDKITEVLDNNMLKDVNESEISPVMQCITEVLQIGLVCTNNSPQRRPNMTEVVEKLNKLVSTFLGSPRTFQLPIDISHMIEDTSAARGFVGESNESTSTS